MGPGLILPFTIEQMSCPAIVGQKMQGRPPILPALFLICQAGLRGKPTGAAFCFPLYFHSCLVTKEALASHSSRNEVVERAHTENKTCKKEERKKAASPGWALYTETRGFLCPRACRPGPQEPGEERSPRQAGRQT